MAKIWIVADSIFLPRAGKAGPRQAKDYNELLNFPSNKRAKA
jgi:hypothetical protein